MADGFIIALYVRSIYQYSSADETRKSDAYMAKQYLLEEGVLEESVLFEEESVITQENLQNSLKIMQDNELETALIISDPLHITRL